MNDLGSFLRKLRGSMTFREAAERSGLSHAYIRYLEIGKRPGTNTPINPSPEMLKGLAKAYNHSYKDLMIKAGYSYEDIENDFTEETEEEKQIREVKERMIKTIETHDITSAEEAKILEKYHNNFFKK